MPFNVRPVCQERRCIVQNVGAEMLVNDSADEESTESLPTPSSSTWFRIVRSDQDLLLLVTTSVFDLRRRSRGTGSLSIHGRNGGAGAEIEPVDQP